MTTTHPNSVGSMALVTESPFDRLNWGMEPLGYEAGDVNVRRYVGNDVTTKIDPSGLVITITGDVGKGTIASVQKSLEEIKSSGTIKKIDEDPSAKITIHIYDPKKGLPEGVTIDFPMGGMTGGSLDHPVGNVELPIPSKEQFFEKYKDVLKDNQVDLGSGVIGDWRKVIIAHELAHAITGQPDVFPDGTPNEKFFLWENEMRKSLGLPPRTHYRRPQDQQPLPIGKK